MIPLLLVLAVMTSVPDSLLARADFNRPAWEGALERLRGVDQERGIWLLGELSELDLMEADQATILGHVKGCSLAEAIHPNYAIPEDTLRAFVLHPLTGYYDMLTEWRTELFNVFHEQCTGDVETDVELVMAYLRDGVRIEKRTDVFGPPSPPVATLRRGWGSDTEWASLAVASLRSVGIAARLALEGKGVEAWDGHQWTRLSSTVEEPRFPGASDAVAGRLELRFSADGEPWRATEEVGLARWSRGAWRPVEPPENPVSADLSDTSIIVSVPPGTYLVTAGVRNAGGEPRVWCAQATVWGDSTVVCEADLSIPFADMDRRDLVQGPEPALQGVVIQDASGVNLRVDDQIGKGSPVLVCAADPGEELSKRLLDALETRRHELEVLHVATILTAREAGSGLLADTRGLLWKALGLESGPRLPVVVLWSPDGSLVMCQRGAHPYAVDLAIQSVRAWRSRE